MNQVAFWGDEPALALVNKEISRTLAKAAETVNYSIKCGWPWFVSLILHGCLPRLQSLVSTTKAPFWYMSLSRSHIGCLDRESGCSELWPLAGRLKAGDGASPQIRTSGKHGEG